MNINDLTFFLAMAETGALSRAAAQAEVSQPALTKALRRLEAELAVPLFERSSKGLQLTEYGKEFKKRAEEICVNYSEMVTSISEMKAGDAALVHIGATPATEALVGRVFLRLVESRPALRLKLKVGLSDTLHRDLEAGAIDVAVSPIPQNLHPALKATKIADERGWVACRQGHHLLTLDRAAAAEDFRAERWILPPPNLLARQQIDAFFARAGVEGPHVQIECNYGSSTALFPLVAGSNLLGFFGAQLKTAAYAFGLREVPLESGSVTRQIGILTRMHGTLSPLTNTFINAVIEEASR